MNKIQMTPGPWRVATETLDTNQSDWVEIETVERGPDLPDKGYLLAIVCGCVTEPHPNAALIAAAPEMYQALSAMLADAETLREPYRNEALCEAARAALAKAEGREG